jgi:hypothetical protein
MYECHPAVPVLNTMASVPSNVLFGQGFRYAGGRNQPLEAFWACSRKRAAVRKAA